MIAYKTKKIPKPEKLEEIKKKLNEIGNKYKTQIGKEINDYCKKMGFNMFFDVVMDLRLLGKVKK